jgi:hypothetical protein
MACLVDLGELRVRAVWGREKMNLRTLVSRRALVVLGLLAALAVVVLGGAIKNGRAASAPKISWTFTVLNDTGNTPAAPTPGGNIGYELTGTADQGQTANNLILTESIGEKGKVVSISSTGNPGLSCSGLNTTTLSCSLNALLPGGTFDVVVLFKTNSTASPGSNVSNRVVGNFDNKDTFGPTALVVRHFSGLGNGSLSQSLTLPGDALTAGGVQKSGVTMPPGFLNNFSFVGVTLQNFSGSAVTLPPGCGGSFTCQPFMTATTIPAASTFGTSGPFFNGSNVAAYTWSFTIPVPNNFKAHGVWHTDDNNQNGAAIPECVFSSGNPLPPTAAPGICLVSKAVNPQTHLATYSGLGINNGHGYGY